MTKNINESPAPEPVGPKIPIRFRSVTYGLEGVNRCILPGYILANGTALLEVTALNPNTFIFLITFWCFFWIYPCAKQDKFSATSCHNNITSIL
jgi:hypothetical protein